MKEKIKKLPMPIKVIGGVVIAGALIWAGMKLWKKLKK
jgi:hypothetical protein